MGTVYCALVRWGPEWDGQSIYYTHSKALFEEMKLIDDRQKDVYFDNFSEELKTQLRAVRAAFTKQHPDVDLGDDEDMSISEAMEWLEVVTPAFPVILAGETELNCSWNW